MLGHAWTSWTDLCSVGHLSTQSLLAPAPQSLRLPHSPGELLRLCPAPRVPRGATLRRRSANLSAGRRESPRPLRRRGTDEAVRSAPNAPEEKGPPKRARCLGDHGITGWMVTPCEYGVRSVQPTTTPSVVVLDCQMVWVGPDVWRLGGSGGRWPCSAAR